jgi:ABC-type maltose transport system permease subunit
MKRVLALAAGLVAVPLLLVYLVFQRQITEGVTAGSTKG